MSHLPQHTVALVSFMRLGDLGVSIVSIFDGFVA